MQAQYGSYFFPVNGVDCATSSRVILSPSTGRPLRREVRVEIAGWLEADGQNLLSAQQVLLEASLIVPYQDFVVRCDDGSFSSITLLNGTSISGVRCVDGPHFPESEGAEFATVRRFRATFAAEYILASARTAVVSFAERITQSGTGGPVVRYRPAVNTDPIRQQIYPSSVIRTVISGEAVGHTGYPPFPPSLWPAFLNLDLTQREQRSPKQMGRGWVEYPISWTYVHESIVPLVGFPRLPPL